MPDPVSILRGSAIGIQVLTPEDDDPEVWVGEDEADFMFHPGCQQAFTSEIDTTLYPGRQARFSLICDPKYSPENRKPRLVFPPLRINKQQSSRAGQAPRGTIYLYDLDWNVHASELPQGQVRFSPGGLHIRHLISNKKYRSVAGKSIPLTLSCVAVDRAGVPRRSPRDKHWAMQLRTDPGSKLLVLDELRQLPVWCDGCEQRLEGPVHICDHCDRMNFCPECYGNLSQEQRHGHRLKRSTIDL